MTENIERARKLNRQASDDIDHGRLEAAKVALNEAIRLAPDLAAPYTNLGVLHCWEGELDEAIRLHLKARRLDPNLSAPHINLGVAYAWQGRLDASVQSLKTALQCNPDSAEAWTSLGFTYICQGNIDDAVVASEKAIQLGDGGEAHTNLSIVTTNLENVDTANLQTVPVGAPIGVPAVWCEG